MGFVFVYVGIEGTWAIPVSRSLLQKHLFTASISSTSLSWGMYYNSAPMSRVLNIQKSFCLFFKFFFQVQLQLMGMQQPGVPLQCDAVEEPVFVNAKQYHGILRRRQSRAKLEARNRAIKAKKVKSWRVKPVICLVDSLPKCSYFLFSAIHA